MKTRLKLFIAHPNCSGELEPKQLEQTVNEWLELLPEGTKIEKMELSTRGRGSSHDSETSMAFLYTPPS